MVYLCRVWLCVWWQKINWCISFLSNIIINYCINSHDFYYICCYSIFINSWWSFLCIVNNTKMSVLSLLLILHLLISVGAQSPSFTLSGSVSSLAVGGDKVFASTSSTVYQLSSDLQQVQHISLSNQILRLATTQDKQKLLLVVIWFKLVYKLVTILLHVIYPVVRR